MKEMLRQEKEFMERHVLFYALELPKTRILERVLNSMDSGAAILTTNLTGPRREMSFNGGAVSGLSLQLLAPPTSFYVSTLSYADRLEWVCDDASRVFTVSDVGFIETLIKKEFEGLALVRHENYV